MYRFLCVVLLLTLCNAEEIVSEEIVYECPARNGYYKVEGSCDMYYECTDYEPRLMLCPDGLNFNRNTKWPLYPCSYPTDVPCVGTSQPPKATALCPHQYGFFRSPVSDANHCGQYRMCSGGRAFDMFCPYGLAFDIQTASCNWADLVPGCNHEEFIGFICPVPEYDIQGNPLTVNFEYGGDCRMFYSCQSGRARLLSCDPGLAFDPYLGKCVEHRYSQCVTGLNERTPYIEESSKESSSSAEKTAEEEKAELRV